MGEHGGDEAEVAFSLDGGGGGSLPGEDSSRDGGRVAPSLGEVGSQEVVLHREVDSPGVAMPGQGEVVDSPGGSGRGSRVRSFLGEPFFDDRRVVVRVESVMLPAADGRGRVSYEWAMSGRARSTKATAIIWGAFLTWAMTLWITFAAPMSAEGDAAFTAALFASVLMFFPFIYAWDVRRRLPRVDVQGDQLKLLSIGDVLKEQVEASLVNTTAFSYGKSDYDALRGSVEEQLSPGDRIITSKRGERRWRHLEGVDFHGEGKRGGGSLNFFPRIPRRGGAAVGPLLGAGESSGWGGGDNVVASASQIPPSLGGAARSAMGKSSMAAAGSSGVYSSGDPRKALQGVLRSGASPRMRELARELVSLHSVLDELSPGQGVALEEITGEFLSLVRNGAALGKSPYGASPEEEAYLSESVELLAAPLLRLREGYLAGRRGSLESRRDFLSEKYPASGEFLSLGDGG